MKKLIQVYPWPSLCRPEVHSENPYRVEVQYALEAIYNEMDARLTALEELKEKKV